MFSPADKIRIGQIVIQQLGAADTYTATPTDPRYSDINDVILDYDYNVAALICGNPNHPLAAEFATTQNVPYGGVVASKLGPPMGITIAGRAAEAAGKSKIDSDRANYLNLDPSLFKPLYAWQNNSILYHNATVPLFGTANAVVTVPNVTRGSVCVAPAIYEMPIAAGVLGFLFPFMGADTGAANLYTGIYLRYTQMIVNGQLSVPDIKQMRQQ